MWTLGYGSLGVGFLKGVVVFEWGFISAGLSLALGGWTGFLYSLCI